MQADAHLQRLWDREFSCSSQLLAFHALGSIRSSQGSRKTFTQQGIIGMLAVEAWATSALEC
eukprot:757856-Amphidinium_carterae.1